MAKKRPPKAKKEKEEELPKFGGFQPLAGLKELKDRLAEEEKKKAKSEKPGGAPKPAPRVSPGPSPGPAPRRETPREPAQASSADDELSFHRMMAGVTPLGGGTAARVPVTSEAKREEARTSPSAIRARAQAEAEAVLGHLGTLVGDATRFEVSDDGGHVEGRRADVPPSLLRSLRRGQLPIDARLDLHGLVADEARGRVADFLKQMRTRGERCVLVIHGKGTHSAGGAVLRGEIAAWLSQGRAREHVAAFATAREEDGGEGAVYVALRR